MVQYYKYLMCTYCPDEKEWTYKPNLRVQNINSIAKLTIEMDTSKQVKKKEEISWNNFPSWIWHWPHLILHLIPLIVMVPTALSLFWQHYDTWDAPHGVHSRAIHEIHDTTCWEQCYMGLMTPCVQNTVTWDRWHHVYRDRWNHVYRIQLKETMYT